jgi:hypothetical protein
LACFGTEASCCTGGGARPRGRIISRVVGCFFFVLSMRCCCPLRMIEWTDLYPLPTPWFAWLPTAFGEDSDEEDDCEFEGGNDDDDYEDDGERSS